MVETTNETISIVNGFIFSSKLDEVLLVSSGSSWLPFQEKIEKNKDHTEALSNYISKSTNQNIKSQSWKQVCDIINLEKTWNLNIFMTIVPQLEPFLIRTDTFKTGIFRINSLNIYEHPISLIWNVYLCLDQKVQGMLSRIVYYS